MTVPATPARDELLSLFTHRKCGKTEAARLIDAALAEDRAIRGHPEAPAQTAGTCPTCGAEPGKNTAEGSEPAHTELSGMAAAADKLPDITRTRLDDLRGYMAGLVRAEHRASHGTEVPKLVLEAHERQFLTYALNLAADHMASEDGFTADDETALASLRRLAASPPPENTEARPTNPPRRTA